MPIPTPDYEGQLYETIRALGLLSTADKPCLDAGPGPRGGWTFCCPGCAEKLAIYPGVVECRSCGFIEWGEWEAVARSMAAKFKERAPEEETPEAKELRALLDARIFNVESKPELPVPLYSLAGKTIATAENLMVVQAKMKAGKSSAIGAMLASTVPGAGDCLGFSSSNLQGHAVLHFDTEQSRYDHFNLILRSMVRAHLGAPPFWMRSYYLKGLPIATMKAALRAALVRAVKECGGVHSVIIDGIADLCLDVNDSAEANALVSELEALAMEFKTLIVCVLHENHGSDNGKTRGHLGSQLARKAETNLRLEKGEDGTSVMFADTSRSVHISKKDGPAFRWSEDALAHVSVTDTAAALQAAAAKASVVTLALLCFEGVGSLGMRRNELLAKIETTAGVSASTAKRRWKDMLSFCAIAKLNDRYYLNPQGSGVTEGSNEGQ